MRLAIVGRGGNPVERIFGHEDGVSRIERPESRQDQCRVGFAGLGPADDDLHPSLDAEGLDRVSEERPPPSRGVHEHQVEIGNRTLQFNTTNRLVRSPDWDIGLQKTGYISEAGQCLVMHAKVAGRKLIMVFLDSTGKSSRIADAERVRRWVETTHLHTLSAQAAS